MFSNSWLRLLIAKLLAHIAGIQPIAKLHFQPCQQSVLKFKRLDVQVPRDQPAKQSLQVRVIGVGHPVHIQNRHAAQVIKAKTPPTTPNKIPCGLRIATSPGSEINGRNQEKTNPNSAVAPIIAVGRIRRDWLPYSPAQHHSLPELLRDPPIGFSISWHSANDRAKWADYIGNSELAMTAD